MANENHMLQGWSWARPTWILQPSGFTTFKWPSSFWPPPCKIQSFYCLSIYLRFMSRTYILMICWALYILNIQYTCITISSLYITIGFKFKKGKIHITTYNSIFSLCNHILIYICTYILGLSGLQVPSRWPLVHWLEMKVNCYFSSTLNSKQSPISVYLRLIHKD